jgi:hypothetical protein
VPGGLFNQRVTREDFERELDKIGGRGFARRCREANMLHKLGLSMNS